MKKAIFYNSVGLVCLLLSLAQLPALAQKDKRKKPDDGQRAELRLREAEFSFTEGEKHYILEDYSKALFYFQHVAELNPDNPTVHFKIAEILTKSSKEEDLQKAAISIENALRLEKKNKFFYLLASSIYTTQNNYAKAEQCLETMMKEIRGTDEYLYDLAAIYQYDKKPDEAIRIYNRAETLLGISEASSLQKQKIYLDKGKINEAIGEGEKLLDAYPDDERYVMSFAEILAQKGQQRKAIEAIEKFASTHPGSGPSKILLAGLYRDIGEEAKAREILTSAFSDPSIEVSSKILVIGTYNALISQKRAKNTPDAEMEAFALGLFKQLEGSNGDDPNVHIAGGELFIITKHNDLAEKEYLKAIQSGSASFEAWQNLLTLEAQGNKYDSLIFHSEQGLEIFPNQAMLYYYNGAGHMAKNHYREAAASLEQAKRLSSQNPAIVSDINRMLGDAYNGTKDYVKSDKAYDDALVYNPNDTYVLNNYSYYLALRKENLERAERMSAQAVKDQPTNSSFLDTYAWVLYMREKYKEAKKVMERALNSSSASSTLYEHYGDILFQLGDVEGAVVQWQKARSLTTQHDLIDKKIANRRLY